LIVLRIKESDNLLSEETSLDTPILSQFNDDIFNKMLVTAQQLSIILVKEVEVSEVIYAL
jgi:hypothetical protein